LPSPAGDRRSDKERALAAGFDLHFTKPVEPAALLDLLGEKLPTR
jgi:CheY-like chemotaxis protein